MEDDPRDKHFPIVTSWTLIADAVTSNHGANPALEEFARRYSRPVLEFIEAIHGDRQEAEDLMQGFFADIILEKRLLAKCDSSKRFRPYLKRAVRNYLNDKYRSGNRKKRKPIEEVRPDQWSDAGWERLELHPENSPDKSFHNAWVRMLLENALVSLEAICEKRGQRKHLDLFLGRYASEESEPPSWQELGSKFGLNEKNARSRSHTVARHFKAIIRQILCDELESEKSTDEEIAALLALM